MTEQQSLTREQQSLLFSLPINIREIFADGYGMQNYYLHLPHNKDQERKRIETTMFKLKMKYEWCCTISGISTQHETIYLVRVPKLYISYLIKGQSESMKKEVAKNIELSEHGYFI